MIVLIIVFIGGAAVGSLITMAIFAEKIRQLKKEANDLVAHLQIVCENSG